MNEELLNIKEAANIRNVQISAIYASIRAKKLKSIKRKGKHYISPKDLEEYEQNLYSRKKMNCQGRMIYDPLVGNYSPKEIAEILNITLQKVYYLIRKKSIPATKYGCAYVINIEGVKKFLNQDSDMMVKIV